MEATFVIVGGGIAGVSCLETLAFLQPDEKVILISESRLVKTAVNFRTITKTLVAFDVAEKDSSVLGCDRENVQVVHGKLVEINSAACFVVVSDGTVIKYRYLCLCTGARPSLIKQAENSPHVLGIRDTDSVDNFLEKLSHSRRVIVTGNGGIASELVFKMKNTELIWIVRDKHITATFVDPGAAEFFQSSLNAADGDGAGNSGNNDERISLLKRMRYEETGRGKSGAALGPDWYKNLKIGGGAPGSSLKIIYESEISDINPLGDEDEFKFEAALRNGQKIKADLLISATGVRPCADFKCDAIFDKAEDGGLKINEFMRTNLERIYAAGDVCFPNWPLAKHWFPMKLWSQARQMGCYAANCMSSALSGQEMIQDFCFEMFAHSTKLYGYKVILLGLYNGQKLGNDYEILLRTTKGLEYIKFVIQNHRLQGAILIGDTDLEEMCENLILNQLDLSPYGDDILNPDIDIEDYFD